MTVQLDGNVLTLTGTIGQNSSEWEFVTHGDVVRALTLIDDAAPLTVHINSPGGWTDEGAGIYNALRARSGRTHTIVHGIAASCGSVIAMAGDRVSMALGGIMMIHEARGAFFGPTSEIPALQLSLEAWNSTMAKIYATRRKISLSQVRALMAAETWFEPHQAVAAGFADDVLEDAPAARIAAFAYGSFQHPPQHLVTMAAANGWSGRPRSPEPKEPTVSQQNPAPGSAVAQATARIRAIMKHAEADGRAELAEHLAYETEMTAEAAGAILAKAPKAASAAGGVDMEEYDRARAGDIYAMRRLGGERLNGEGLNGAAGAGLSGRGGTGMSVGKVDLVAAMKRRHGVK